VGSSEKKRVNLSASLENKGTRKSKRRKMVPNMARHEKGAKTAETDI
jgi:hypothetical protein